MVRKGIVDYPELWQWHIPGTRWGVADWVDYTPDGFAVASGTVDPGSEHIAEAYAKDKPGTIKVSHGMPKPLLIRDVEDKSIINFHVTTEISPLPSTKEANPLTGFHVLSSGNEVKMSLLDEQRKFLESHGLTPEAVDQIASGLKTLGEQAKAEGRESKNKEGEEDETDAASEPVQETKPDETKPDEPTEPSAANESQYVTVEQFDALRAEIAESMGEIVTGSQELGKSIASVAAIVKELQADDGEKIAKAAQDTPPASLSALIAQSVIGKQATQVDGRSSIAKDKPKETDAPAQGNGLFFEEWIGSGSTLAQ